MRLLILGDGHLGRAVHLRAADRGVAATVVGRPAHDVHPPATFRDGDVIIDATHGDQVARNVDAGLRGGARRFVIATTGWTADHAVTDRHLRDAGAAAVVAANLSVGVALFGRLVALAAELYGSLADVDPYLLEWHRRSKADRPSGTALGLAARLAERHPRLASATDLEVVSIRAGSSPGMHLVGFDGPGETVELRLTARDRTAYADGALAAADWLFATPRSPGIHDFDQVVDALLARPALAA